MKLVLSGRDAGELRDIEKASVTLDAPAARVETAAWLEGKNKRGDAVIALSVLEGLTPEALRTASRIIVNVKSKGEWAFEVPEAGRSMSEVGACHDRLFAQWHIDPNLIKSLRAKPEPVPNDRWFRNSDYPLEAIRSNAAGDTVVRFVVGTDGKVHDCVTVASSGDEALDTASCAIISKRARYRPALNAEGAPTAVTYPHLVRWRLPSR